MAISQGLQNGQSISLSERGVTCKRIDKPKCTLDTSELWLAGPNTTALQGVVTYMSRVGAFATGIKIESSDQSPFGGSD